MARPGPGNPPPARARARLGTGDARLPGAREAAKTGIRPPHTGTLNQIPGGNRDRNARPRPPPTLYLQSSPLMARAGPPTSPVTSAAPGCQGTGTTRYGSSTGGPRGRLGPGSDRDLPGLCHLRISPVTRQLRGCDDGLGLTAPPTTTQAAWRASGGSTPTLRTLGCGWYSSVATPAGGVACSNAMASARRGASPGRNV